MRKGWTKYILIVAVFALIAAACGDDDDTPAATTAAPPDTPATTMDSGPDLAGTEVNIFGAFTSVEADAVNNVIAADFNGPTGSDAVSEGSDSFEEQIKIRVEGGNPPDIALYPQPGSVVEQAELGNAIALEDLGFNIADLEALYGSYLLSLGEYNGKHYGLPTNVSSKSLVWYNLPVFEAEGYVPPTTWDEWQALADQMVADGYTPICIGTGSDAATGWPATDWMEDIMLRTAGADVYDQWVSHDIPFNAPEVTRAAELLGEWAFNEDWILGNTSNIPDLDFRDAPDPMFADPPGCLMHRQASFIVNFFPEGVQVGVDASFFPFPSIDEGVSGNLIAGEMAAIFRDAPEVRAFLEFFTSTETQCTMGQQPGVQRISPDINVGSECYSDELVGGVADSITSALAAGGARFDASDLMPSAVGSSSFWTAMNEWMRGKELATALQDVEDSWPAS
jgi:alpha-glucoside transport system substrate-binding protein